MDLLHLNKTRLPASAFPEPAEEYFCDKCERDITKHLHRHGGHGLRMVGREHYLCHCGQKYLTGATEWVHLGWERKLHIRSTFGESIVVSVLFAIVGFAIYFGFGRSRAALIVAGVITALPFLLMQAAFWLEVAASIRRTRTGKNIES